MGLPFHPAAGQETFESWTATSCGGRARQELTSSQTPQRLPTGRLSRLYCTLPSYPELSILEKLEMLTSGTNAGNGTN